MSINVFYNLTIYAEDKQKHNQGNKTQSKHVFDSEKYLLSGGNNARKNKYAKPNNLHLRSFMNVV